MKAEREDIKYREQLVSAKSSALMYELSRILTMYPRTVSANWDLCLHILFTRHRLVPLLHLEWYLNYNSMLTQQTDLYLMESLSQMCMQSTVLGIQSFFSKHPHDAVKEMGLLILGCLWLCENRFKSLVFFTCNFSPKMSVTYQCKMRWYHFLFERIQFKYILHVLNASLEKCTIFNEKPIQRAFQSELCVWNKKFSS